LLLPGFGLPFCLPCDGSRPSVFDWIFWVSEPDADPSPNEELTSVLQYTQTHTHTHTVWCSPTVFNFIAAAAACGEP